MAEGQDRSKGKHPPGAEAGKESHSSCFLEPSWEIFKNTSAMAPDLTSLDFGIFIKQSWCSAEFGVIEVEFWQMRG